MRSRKNHRGREKKEVSRRREEEKERKKKELSKQKMNHKYLGIVLEGKTVINLIFALKIIQNNNDFRRGPVEIVI